MLEQDEKVQYIDIEILIDEGDGYKNKFERSYAVAGTPRKGDLVKVDGAKFEVQQVQFNTERNEAHLITVYVKEYSQPVGAVFL